MSMNLVQKAIYNLYNKIQYYCFRIELPFYVHPSSTMSGANLYDEGVKPKGTAAAQAQRILDMPDAVGDVDHSPYVSQFDKTVRPESTSEKMHRRVMESPLVPVLLLCTVGSLCGGLWAFKNSKQKLSNQFQRARVGFQGLTVVAFCFGAYTETRKEIPMERPEPTGKF